MVSVQKMIYIQGGFSVFFHILQEGIFHNFESKISPKDKTWEFPSTPNLIGEWPIPIIFTASNPCVQVSCPEHFAENRHIPSDTSDKNTAQTTWGKFRPLVPGTNSHLHIYNCVFNTWIYIYTHNLSLSESLSIHPSIHLSIYIYILVGVAITILKNDGVREWGRDDIPYEMGKIIHSCSKIWQLVGITNFPTEWKNAAVPPF